MSAEPLLLLFHDGTAYSFGRSDEHSPSWFGGPLDPGQQFSGVPLGKRPLQSVAHLSPNSIPELWHSLGSRSLTLVYGFNYDGCEIRYRRKITGWIEILDLSPRESSEYWPYAHYPAFLPYVPLRLSGTRRCTYAEFAEEIPNMVEAQPAELIAAVPAPDTLGVSLWGPWGDASAVTVVFECDLGEGTVRAYNRFIT